MKILVNPGNPKFCSPYYVDFPFAELLEKRPDLLPEGEHETIEGWLTEWIDNIYNEIDEKIEASGLFVAGTGVQE